MENSDLPAPVDELLLALQRLCSRQRLRADERLYVRDVERALLLLRPHAARVASSTVLALSDAELELLFECLADLTAHRNPDVRALALEAATLSLGLLSAQLGATLRRKAFALLEAAPPGDFTLRQKMLRVLTLDGRRVEPFRVELGWLLLRLLEQSDEQRDLVGLVQTILRRSPSGLDSETVVAITSVLCARADAAWARGDVDCCKRVLGFFHVLASHGLEYAASTAASLRTLCCMVNADGYGTWSVMKLLLNGAAGFQVLRGLVSLLETPFSGGNGTNSQWVLRGAVFFVGMSCWGSQRVGQLEDVKWAPVLLALERVLACNNGVVIFEVILAFQRLIKKFGAAAKPDVDAKLSLSLSSAADKRLLVEWDIILRMFRALRPWLSLADDAADSDDGESYSSVPSMMTYPQVAPHPQSEPLQPHVQVAVSIHQTRIPRELLDTLSVVEDLVAHGQFAGDTEAFFDVLEDYLQYLNERSTLCLLRHRAAAAHPAHDAHWLQTLSDAMLSFFTNGAMLGAVRLEALDVLRSTLQLSRHVCEDRVIDDVLLPTLAHVFDDHHADVRRRGLELVTDAARGLESARFFDALLDVLTNAVTLALYEDAQVHAANGIVALFAASFHHLPHARSLRLYELVARVVETHRQPDVRRIALACLLQVCEADADSFRLVWTTDDGGGTTTTRRASRFLYVARRAVHSAQTGACVPVARALRAMLTLVSTETHADLFRMAVHGIRRMLENRVVLTDVDLSDMTLKLVSSIDYRAFGRAAIPDELARLTDDDNDDDNDDATWKRPAKTNGRRDNDAPVSRANAWELLSRRHAEADTLRYTQQQRSRVAGDPGVGFKTSVRDTLVVLCKTRFMTMGLELLALLTGYATELNATARHHLIACLVGTLGMPLAVAEKDLLVATTSSTESGRLATSRSTRNVVRDDVGSDYALGGVGAQYDSGGLCPDRVSSGYVATRLSDQSLSRDSVGKPASPPHFGFTSRMLSRFQTTTGSHGNLFTHVLPTSSTLSSTTPSPAECAARKRLAQSLRALYDAEFALLFVTTNVLSLLAVRTPTDVAAAVDVIFASARVCFTTPDGDFRADGYGATLEMVANVVYALPSLNARCYEAVVELLLVGLEYAKSKQLAYLAFRLLSYVIFKCAPVDRGVLASVALPRLQQLERQRHSLLVEAAIDFLMSHAFSRSLPPAPTRRSGRLDADSDERTVVHARSWVYKRSILTIQVTAHGSAELVIRRASCTNRWDLQLSQDFEMDANTLSAVLPAFEDVGGTTGDTRACVECAIAGGRDVDGLTTTSVTSSSEAVVVAVEVKETSGGCVTVSEDVPLALPPPVPVASEVNGGAKTTTKTRAGSTRRQVSFELRANSPTIFPHPSAALPPLPAYDGIGGSPSYFCEAHPAVRRRNPTRAPQSTRESAKRGLLSASPFDSTLETPYDNDDDEDDGPDDFSLDGSSAQPTGSAADSSNGASVRTTPGAGPSDSASASALERREPSTLDPLFLMMQLFDLTAESRPLLLTDGPALSLGLSVLDRTPTCETHKVGLLYVRTPHERTEADILRASGGSLRYLQFLRGLGAFTKLDGLFAYSGGLDCTSHASDGQFGLLYKDACTQIMFHVATLMGLPETDGTSTDRVRAMNKKRHIGNDFVHVVYKECDAAYDVGTFSGQFNDVHIVVQPLNDREYRTQVYAKPGLQPFGPLHGTQVVSSAEVAACVRLTCVNANLACQTFHQDLVGFALNCEERLKQIKQLGLRLAHHDDWQLDVEGGRDRR